MTDKERTEARGEAGRWLPEEARKHLRAAREELRESMLALFPPEFTEHRRAARREALLALRSLIDHALERMEGQGV